MLQKLRGNNAEGFTLIELMIVIAIIGILAAIAIPNFIAYRMRGYNSQANADVKNAFTSCQAHFVDFPGNTIACEDADNGSGTAETAGWNKADATTCLITGLKDDLAITCSHPSGDKQYSCGPEGNIEEY